MKKNILSTLAGVSLLGLLLSGCFLLPSSTPTLPDTEGAVLSLDGVDPHTLDPAVSGEMTSHEYILQIYSGLVTLDDNLAPAPDIAERWQMSDNGLTYTFYLRKNVRFQDGRKVTARDFKYSWGRACSPATGSATAPVYLGDIVGAADVLRGQAAEMSGVRVLDDYTLEVTIDAPKSYFLYKMTYPTSFVVDKDNVASGSAWWHQPNGTGPFRLKEWQPNTIVSLERNELYYGEMAKVAGVDYHLFSGVPMNLYEQGTIDTAGVSVAYIDRVSDERGPFYQDLKVYPELSFYYLGFNTRKPPFDDPDIRRAFSHAVDKNRLASLVYRDMVAPADGILPPEMPGYNESLKGLDYNLDEARELIKNSKYGSVANLPPIVMTNAGEGGIIASDVEAIIYDWRENLGVEVTVRELEPERFLYNLDQELDNVYFSGWVGDYPHPQDFLDILFRSGSETNYGGYSNPEVDALLDRANVELDREKSLALYREAEQKLVDDAACLPLWFGKNYVLVKPYIHGYELSPLGIPMLNKVSID